MNRYLIVLIAMISLAGSACEQQPAAPPAQPANTPSPAPTASPEATTSPLTAPTSTPEPQPSLAATPAPTASPLITPAPTPEPQATPTSASETPPAPSPSTTPDSPAPSPTSSPQAGGPEGRPTLSSQPANEYLRSYDAYINDFKSAYQAMKDGDVPRYQSVIRRALELKAKSAQLGGELNAEEEQRFADYLNKKANELSQFASQNR
ncbi:MAG TPA: hypothetical protein VK775_20880 [Chthoniobacterales bacterium]|nr:hypothetical protein [Chthoniobacterales bacterium]